MASMQMDEQGGSFFTDILLSDGSTAAVRSIRADDVSALLAFHSRLSDETIVMRFFGSHRKLSQREVEYFTQVDGFDRVALVVERADSIIAIARYDRLGQSDEAEAAFVVEDEFQGKGLGTILLEHLAARGRDCGIRRFIAFTLASNVKMLNVFRDAGFASSTSWADGVIKVILDINPTEGAIAASDERDRLSVVRSLERLLCPKSIAVVGASRRRGTIGRELVQNLISGGFEGTVYPVNPNSDHVASMQCWPSIESIPGEIDLAVICVPAQFVESVVDSCGKKSVGALVIISAGFAETGDNGRSIQETIVRSAHAYGMRVVGPNCFGVINTDPKLSMNSTFSTVVPLAGNVGFASQSGGLGIAMLAEAAERGLGISSFVSMGNKADISTNDLLRWWAQDPRTDVILLYLESFGNTKKFKQIAATTSRLKPVIAVKSGRSSAGSRAASSHTAAMANSDEAVDAIFRQTGIIRVDTTEELFDVGEVFASQPLPAGPRVGIVGNSGGSGVLAADACIGYGLEVPELSQKCQAKLRAMLAPGAGVRNPVDLIASATADSFREALELLLEEPEIDALVVIFTPPLVTKADDVAHAVAAAVNGVHFSKQDHANAKVPGAGFGQATQCKPVIASFLGDSSATAILHSAIMPIPNFAYPETAVRALSHAVAYSKWLTKPAGKFPVLTGTDANSARQAIHERFTVSDWVTGSDAMDILEKYGIATIKTTSVFGIDEAADVARGIGYPIALKATGESIIHKTDIGGVRLDLAGEAQLRQAFSDMKRKFGDRMSGAVVQPMAPKGVELIAGFVRDQKFGPMILFGLGGISAELFNDHISLLAPITEEEAREMVSGLRTSALLTGYRGSPGTDIDQLCGLLMRISKMADDLPELAELDCNPIIAGPGGSMVVDARIRGASEPMALSFVPRQLG